MRNQDIENQFPWLSCIGVGAVVLGLFVLLGWFF